MAMEEGRKREKRREVGDAADYCGSVPSHTVRSIHVLCSLYARVQSHWQIYPAGIMYIGDPCATKGLHIGSLPWPRVQIGGDHRLMRYY
jgi:hydroxypyruvate isomerase